MDDLYEKIKSASKHLEKLTSISLDLCGYLEKNVMFGAPEIQEVLHWKRCNLFSLAKNAQNIMEIGFSSGYSTLLFLLANDTSKIQIFDNGHLFCARPCFEYLDKEFPGRLNIVWGDSSITLPNFHTHIKYDLVHMDGSWNAEVFASDIINCKKNCNPDSNVIVDLFSSNRIDIVNQLIKLGYVKNKDLNHETKQICVQYNF